MEKLSFEMKELLQQAEALIASEESAQQVLLVRTSRDNTYSVGNPHILSDGLAEEEKFVNLLLEKEDTELKFMVCMWKNHELDLPSWHMRTLLEQINPLNQEMQILLKGNQGYIVKKLKMLKPPSSLED